MCFTEFPGFTVPPGFTADTYFNHLVSARYGKLVPAGAEWKDSRSGEPVSVTEIEEAVARAQAKRGGIP